MTGRKTPLKKEVASKPTPPQRVYIKDYELNGSINVPDAYLAPDDVRQRYGVYEFVGFAHVKVVPEMEK